MQVSNLRQKIAVLLAFCAVSIGIFYIFYRGAGGRLPFTHPSYEVSVRLPTGETLVPGSDVDEVGITVGRVEGVGRTPSGQADVRFTLDKQFAPLTDNARVQVRTKTILGESYLAVYPGAGKSTVVPNNGRLPASAAENEVQLDQLLSTFDPATRQRLRADLATLSGSFAGRGQDLNQALAAAEPTFSSGATVMQVLAQQRQEVAGVTANASQLLQTLSSRGQALELLIRQAREAALAASARDTSIAEMVRRLPGVLRQAQRLSRPLATFGDVSTPVLANLARAATALTPAIDQLAPASASAQQFLHRLPPVLRVADPLLHQLSAFSAAAPALTHAVPPLLCQLNPALEYLKPYHRDIGGFFADMGMVNDEQDNLGRNMVQTLGAAGIHTLGVYTPEMRKQLQGMLEALGIGKVYNVVGYNPYPQPGTAGHPQPMGSVPRVDPCKQ